MRSPDLPVRVVTLDEFIRILAESGEPNAERHAKFASILGCEVLVGDEYLKIGEHE